MSSYVPTFSLPPDLLDEIFEQLSPYARTTRGAELGLEEVIAAQAALARCARACRAFERPALKALWREQRLTQACSAPVASATSAAFKGPADEEDEEDEEVDVEGNVDWPESIDPDDNLYVYTCYPGPITADEWARFEYYAQFIRVLRYTIDEAVNPTIFFFLQQYARGKPLFPNLREVVWEHAVPELLSVISPTIRVLRFLFNNQAEENYARPKEAMYCMRRHTFKTLLPSMLQSLPELRELYLRPLGHPGFWHSFTPEPHHHFVAQHIHTLHITESLAVLLWGALPAVSTIQNLEELKIDCKVRPYSPWTSIRWDSSRIHEFSQLRRLQIESDTIAVAELVNAVVSPNLRDIQLGCSHPVSQAGAIPYGVTNLLHEILRILCDRSAESLRSVNINFGRVFLPHSETETDSAFLHLILPTLQFHRLEQLVINAIAAYNGELVMGMLTPAILAAWPRIELLNIPVLSVSPDTLEAATRTCPHLKSLTVMRLSENFLGRLEAAVQNHSRRDGHELQELRLCIPAKVTTDPANTAEIARFLCQLFPRLHIEQCSGGKDVTFRQQENWLDVLKEVQRLQDAM